MSNLRQKHNSVCSNIESKKQSECLEELSEKLDVVISLLRKLSEKPEQIVIERSVEVHKETSDNTRKDRISSFIPQIDTEGMTTSAKAFSSFKKRDLSGNIKTLKKLSNGDNND